MFFTALVLVRVAGMRAFGRKSSFDTIVTVLLGAVLSRAIYGASPALPIIAACATLVVVHRGIARVTARFPNVERLVKGPKLVVFRDGAEIPHLMRAHGISHADLLEATRRQLHHAELESVAEIWLESSGELTVLRRA